MKVNSVVGLLVLFLAVGNIGHAQTTRLWQGDSGWLTESEWFHAANWDPEGTPDPADYLYVFSRGEDYAYADNPVSIDGGSITIDGFDSMLQIGGSPTDPADFTMKRGSLRVSGGARFYTWDSAYIGKSDSIGATSYATVTGIESKWYANYVDVGVSVGIGAINVVDKGYLETQNVCNIGRDSGAQGTVTVSGVGSRWANTASVSVGRYGKGTLQVLDGGQVTNTGAIVAEETSSIGLVRVAGSAARWTSSGDLHIGSRGIGTLQVVDGGEVANTGGTLGLNIAGRGDATVSGPGAKWTNTGELTVGYTGTGTLCVLSGGAVTSDAGFLGRSSGAGGEATVAGAGSKWTNNLLTVGDAGTGTVRVLDGGLVVSNAGAVIGKNTDGHGEVTVSGPGAKWTNTNDLIVGDLGAGAMSVVDAGTVTNSIGGIGWLNGGSGSVTVQGPGSKWTSTSDLIVGREGKGTLEVLNGGMVSSNTGRVGENAGSEGTVTISGAGSKWTATADIWIGNNQKGTMYVLDGGQVSSSGAVVGRMSTAVGRVQVAGANARWTDNGPFALLGYFGDATLEIVDGGRVTNNDAIVAYLPGSQGAITVDGTGSSWTTTGILNLGIQAPGTLDIRNGGQVAVSGWLVLGSADNGRGTVNLEGGTLTAEAIDQRSSDSGIAWTGGGLKITGTGGLNLSASGPLGPNVVVHTGKSLTVANATSVQSGVQLTVNGGIFSTNLLDVYGSVQLVGGAASIRDTFYLRSGGTLEIVAGQTVSVASAPSLTDGSTLMLSGGTLRAVAVIPEVVNDGRISGWGQIQGNLHNHGEIAVGAGQQLAFTGDLDNNSAESGIAQISLSGGTLSSQTILTNQNGALIMGNGTIRAAGIGISNRSTMAFSGATNLYGDVRNYSIGLIIVSGGGPTTFYDDVRNDGEIRVSAGCMATFFGETTGTGSWTGDGTKYFEGDLKPGSSPASVFFEGNVGIGSSASLVMELAGILPGTQYDKIAVADSLILGGLLDVQLIDGFVPEAGNTFDLMDWGTLVGTFDAILLPELAASLKWDTDDLYVSGELAVIPAVRIPGDANEDGIVNDKDASIVGAHWMATGAAWEDGDFNDDEVVNDKDAALLAAYWGYTAPSESADVPEPSTLLLLSIGSLVLLVYAGRRRPR
jgi:T5SS/PEP-CTERM-associated repeat protein